MRRSAPWHSAVLVLLLTRAAPCQAEDPRRTEPVPADPAPDLRSEITQYLADLHDLGRRYDVPMSEPGRLRLEQRHREQIARLDAMPFDALPTDARVDWCLLRDLAGRRLADLALARQRDREVAELVPFAPALTALLEAQRQLEPVAPRAAADALTGVQAALRELQQKLAADGFAATPLPVAARAAERIAALRRAMRTWFEFHDGYDPQFSFWLRSPFAAVDAALERWQQGVRERLVDGRAGDASLVGDPIGEAALLRELALERIPYGPAELVAIAEREFAFCDAESAKASAALGCGDDWRRALAKVKQLHVEPGRQPELVRDLAREAIAFVEARDLVTIPDLAKECWRMSMMSPAAQRVNPFFLGGETIQVSYPTESMSHQEKLQSLLSNNVHFARATVHHELIPGHWLQQFMQARHRTWREAFETPFWIEGWALYWEMRLYDLGFPRGPEDRIGMLYWRKHRCARIVFSLNFHLGRWTGPQCVDYLVERVGHERAAAEGEVRRSVGGAYGPLYQAAYMLGGLQLRALHAELVASGRLTEKALHDEVLRQNAIPIALLRAALRAAHLAEPVTRDAGRSWRFADPGR